MKMSLTATSKPCEPSAERPHITSLEDMDVWEVHNGEADTFQCTVISHVSQDDRVFLGESLKRASELSLEEKESLLQRIKDELVFPKVPLDVPLTMNPDPVDESTVFVKRPGLQHYKAIDDPDFVPMSMLEEALIMEQIWASPHPNFVKYKGCRVNRGRITAILVERLDRTLGQIANHSNLHSLDSSAFCDALESAVTHLHSLGLAHNDINPSNIMVKDGEPILIDFGSCQPFGHRLRSLGTVGWYKERFFFSDKSHDDYSLARLREWFKEQQDVQGPSDDAKAEAMAPLLNVEHESEKHAPYTHDDTTVPIESC